MTGTTSTARDSGLKSARNATPLTASPAPIIMLRLIFSDTNAATLATKMKAMAAIMSRPPSADAVVAKATFKCSGRMTSLKATVDDTSTSDASDSSVCWSRTWGARGSILVNSASLSRKNIMTSANAPASVSAASRQGMKEPSEDSDPPISGPMVKPNPPQKYTMTKRLPRSEDGYSESSIAIAPDCRNVLPTPPMVRLKKRMGKDEPAMNMMQLKKKTTCAVAIIIQHLTCPARKSVSGVPMAAPAQPTRPASVSAGAARRTRTRHAQENSNAWRTRLPRATVSLTKAVARKEQGHLRGGKIRASDEMVRRHQGDEVSVQEAREENGQADDGERHLALFILHLHVQQTRGHPPAPRRFVRGTERRLLGIGAGLLATRDGSPRGAHAAGHPGARRQGRGDSRWH